MGKRRRTLYMHTIDGRPAFYVPGEQICFCGDAGSVRSPLATSLAQIRREQVASDEWRNKRGFMRDLTSEYGYVRIPAAALPKEPGDG